MAKFHLKFMINVMIVMLTLNAPITAKVVCFSRLLKCLRSLYVKQCGPRSDCSYRSSLFWVHAVFFYTEFVSNVKQLFAADDSIRRHFQMRFFLGALRVKTENLPFIDGDVLRSLSYIVYGVDLSRVCSNVDDSINRNVARS